MYSNMSVLQKFKENVIADQRSYQDETVDKAVKILNSSKKNINIDQDLKANFEILVLQLKEMKAQA
jgi:hypothetical protein